MPNIKYLDYDGLIYYHSKVTGLLADKVDKVTGKGLSTEDFTTADKNKLAGIAAGAEVNVQADWDETVTTADSYIQNKPTLATVATSGSYNDLSNKPTIGNATLTIQKNGASAGTFTANATSNKSINITVPTTAADVSALPDSTKYGASLTMSINTTDYKITTTLKDQDGNTLGTAQVIDLPLESVVVSGSYDNTNKKIILTLQNGSTIDIPVGDLVAGLQTEITSTNKLSSDLVDDTGHTHKFATSSQLTKLDGLANIKTIGANLTLSGAGQLSATDTTYSDFGGATSSSAGTTGLVPAPASGDNTKYLSGDGTWKTVSVYQLPIASSSTLGGIKVGTNLSINSSTGVLSAVVPTIDTTFSTTSSNAATSSATYTWINTNLPTVAITNAEIDTIVA